MYSDIRSKPGAEPGPAELRYAEAVEYRGIRKRDSVLVARMAGIAIWQTEKTATNDMPTWLPAFHAKDGPVDALYRGVAVAQLVDVLRTGLDVPPQTAFFASNSPSYAWEYPHSRQIAAMLVLDRKQTERSFVATSTGATNRQAVVDKARYPNHYEDGDIHVHTRFAAGRGTSTYFSEYLYGFWIPGDTRTALIAVVLGGPYPTVLRLIQECAPADLEMVR